MDPKQSDGASKDTRKLFEVLKYIQAQDFTSESGQPLASFAAHSWWSLIIKTRSFVLYTFLEAKRNQATPKMWLSFR
jgi:hypothetical protein